MPDHSRAATYYRTALLLGLIRGCEVHQWAEQVIAGEPKPAAAFVDLMSVPVDDLSEMRHALWPLVIDPPPSDVLDSILGLVQSQLAEGRRSVEDTVTVLRQIRSMIKMSRELYDALGAALIAHDGDPATGSIGGWLRQFPHRSSVEWSGAGEL